MLQNQPNEWVVFAIPGTDHAQYWARGTSEFSVNYNYHAFPFDRQGSVPLLSFHRARHSELGLTQCPCLGCRQRIEFRVMTEVDFRSSLCSLCFGRIKSCYCNHCD